MENYLIDLFIESARQQRLLAPGWLVRLYLTIFSAPLGKTLRIDMVRSLLKGQNLQGKRVLDAGCGIGDLSLLLAKQGANVVGIELDPQKVASATRIAQGWHFERVRFLAGDVTRLNQIALGQFDAIFCLALLEHIQEDVALLHQLQRMLCPGGIFVLEVPSARRRTIPAIEAADGHVRPGYLFEEVPDLLARTGFRVTNQRTMDPLGLNYYWCKWSRPGSKAQRWLFTLLAPLFIFLIRLTSAFIKRPGCELCFLAEKAECSRREHPITAALVQASDSASSA
jgi:ubiquinone/menaquinone biosynthesis C-methylase UbiE